MLVHTPEQPPRSSANLLVCFMGEGKLLTHVDGTLQTWALQGGAAGTHITGGGGCRRSRRRHVPLPKVGWRLPVPGRRVRRVQRR